MRTHSILKMRLSKSFVLSLLLAAVVLTGGGLTAQTFRTLHSFSGGSEGANPHADLTPIGNTLYGTTQGGGNAGDGTIYTINADGSGFATYHSFSGSDGLIPNRLVVSGTTLYGTTYSGGSSSRGTVFAINADGTTFHTLYNFTGGADGTAPQGANILSGTTLYGTTYSGGAFGKGTVFKVNTDGTGLQTLHSFTATSPNSSGVYVNGDGTGPGICLILSGNVLYGTAYQGGGSGQGIVFKVNTDGTGFVTLHSFEGSSDGANPFCDLALSGNTLFGTAWGGGSSDDGTVFAVNTDGTGFTLLHSFSGSDGRNPSNAGLVLSGNKMFGTALAGGDSDKGTVFTINTDGTGFTNLHSFTGGSDGAFPEAGLILLGGNLFGTTTRGGTSGNGVVFTISLPVTPPHLTITSSGENVMVSWPTTSAGFTLQSTASLASPQWTTNLPAPIVVNGQNTVTIPIAGDQQFTRLSQ